MNMVMSLYTFGFFFIDRIYQRFLDGLLYLSVTVLLTILDEIFAFLFDGLLSTDVCTFILLFLGLVYAAPRSFVFVKFRNDLFRAFNYL